MRHLTLLVMLCCVQLSPAQYADPNFPIPAMGYGSNGPHTIGVVAFPNPNFANQDIRIYHPSDITEQVPTLFYSHAFGGNDPQNIIGLLEFVARKGYAIVFVPYQTVGVSVPERYDNLLAGFRKAARDHPQIIDTTRVGFMGHSFGGGATIATAYRCFTENGWGQNGRYMHASAPWYSFNISQAELQSFPADTKLLMQVYDDDTVNDHRMAVDIFSNINIDADEKDFIVVRADTVNGYIYEAGHNLPMTYAAFDAMDHYAYYRLIDALCDYTFNGNLAGKEVALGNGSAAQVGMPPGMNDLVQSDAPFVDYPESRYGFPCSAAGNPRSMYCAIPTGLPDPNSSAEMRIFPNPFRDRIQLENAPSNAQYSVHDVLGRTVFMSGTMPTMDLGQLSNDIYFLKVMTADRMWTFPIIKQ
jgi:pimeloyl-ACP methyl ester carboxylesterase